MLAGVLAHVSGLLAANTAHNHWSRVFFILVSSISSSSLPVYFRIMLPLLGTRGPLQQHISLSDRLGPISAHKLVQDYKDYFSSQLSHAAMWHLEISA